MQTVRHNLRQAGCELSPGAPSCLKSRGAIVQVTPDWERLAAHIEADLETKELLGWVREVGPALLMAGPALLDLHDLL